MSAVVTMIAGLGNPDSKYERTLHNAGFWFVDALLRKYGGKFRYDKKFDAEICRIDLQGNEVWLVKPHSFMNLSGGPVRGVLDYYRLQPEQLLVAHDGNVEKSLDLICVQIDCQHAIDTGGPDKLRDKLGRDRYPG